MEVELLYPFCISSVCFHAVQSAPELRLWRNGVESSLFCHIACWVKEHQRVSRWFWTMRIFVLLCRRAWLGNAFHLILFKQQQLGCLMRPLVRCIKTLVYPAFLPLWFFWLSIFLFAFFPSLFHRQTLTDAHTYVSGCLTSHVWAPLPSVPHSQRPFADSQHFLI